MRRGVRLDKVKMVMESDALTTVCWQAFLRSVRSFGVLRHKAVGMGQGGRDALGRL